MDIIPLSEGTFTVDKTKLFAPFNERDDELQKRPVGSLLVEIQPFVVTTSKDILLLDTGLGFMRNAELQIHQNLRANGIEPSSVTKVLLTHLHKDHAGGIAERTNGQSRLSFERAQYYVQERELNFAFEKGFPSYITQELQLLQRSSRVTLLKDNAGIIDEYISYQVTGAHSAYHQVFQIRGENEIIFFGGDDAPQLQQMKHRFVAKYDYNGKKAMELRKAWWEQGQKEKWTFLFYHDMKTPIYANSDANSDAN
jgi:glyoxylase-like metal-dependent hydrolase (beta-lactamase superfamily II)